MEVLILTTFVSVFLAAAGVGLFVWSVRARTFDQSDRLALLPLDDGPAPSAPATPAPQPSPSNEGTAETSTS
jgi:cbb3-type cytochrome oxidase maturation protein